MKIFTVSIITAVALASGSFWAAPVAAQISPSPAGQAAPSPEALQAARDLTSIISVNTITELTQNVTNQVWPALETAVRSKNPNISPAALADLRREFERQQFAIALDSLNDAVGIYARNFTVEELRALAAFYRTPVGAKALTVMPRTTVELIAAMGPRLQTLQAKFGETVVKLLETNASSSTSTSRPAATAK
jgi:hypothetical protein